MGAPETHELYGLARLPLLLLDRAAEFGLDRTSLVRRAGLSERDLADPDARIPVQKMWALSRLAIEETRRDDLAIELMATTPLRAYGLVGYVMAHCTTIAAALDRLARYSRIVTEAVAADWSLDADCGTFLLQDRSSPEPPRPRTDSRLTFVVTAVTELAGRRIVPREIHFPYPRPPCTAAHERFLGGTLIFDSPPGGAIVYERHDLDLPVVGADITLGKYLDDLAENVLQAMPATATFQDRVRRAIWSGLRRGRVELASVAADLAVSGRTAQRKLRDEGTSYAELLDDVRRELAMGMLQGRDLAVYEVAFLLGYSEPSTFHRAFRRWTGTSPREFRRSPGPG